MGAAKILIVEDEVIIANELALVLTGLGYQITAIAAAGDQAIHQVEQNMPDIVLMDINIIGDKDGIETADIIRSRFDVPVIFLTAYAGDEKIERAKLTMPYGYLIKPIQNRELRVTIEMALHSHQIEVERKQAEESLRESEELTRILLNNISDLVFLCDDSGRFVFVCPKVKRVLGLTVEEVLSYKSATDLFGKPLFDAEELAQKGEIANVDCTIPRKDGTLLHFLVSVKKVTIKGGAVLFTCRDVTDRFAAEQTEKLRQKQLVQADKMISLGILVSGMAHEINNPNYAISTNLFPLKRFWEDILPILGEYHENIEELVIAGIDFESVRKQVPQIFDNISRSTGRINNIVEELKQFAQDQPVQHLEKIQLNNIIQSAITLLHPMIRKTVQHFNFFQSEDLPFIHGNYQKLEQIVINLIQNACQAIDAFDGSSVAISTYCDHSERQVGFRVVDNGCGIPPELMNRIMDPFFTTKRDIGGIGLGLSISSRLIMEHGGRIQFKNAGIKGTEVQVVFPWIEATDTHSAGNRIATSTSIYNAN